MNEETRIERHRKIREVMVRRGITAAGIGRELGVTRQHVTMVISGKVQSKRVVDALIRAGVPGELFGDEGEHEEAPKGMASGWK